MSVLCICPSVSTSCRRAVAVTSISSVSVRVQVTRRRRDWLQPVGDMSTREYLELATWLTLRVHNLQRLPFGQNFVKQIYVYMYI